MRTIPLRSVLCFALLPAMLGILPAGTFALAPATVNYQGYLADTAGAPVDGAVSMDFALFPAASGGAAVWSESHGAVQVAGGIYRVELGSVASLAAVDFSIPLFLEITVGGEQMSERLPFSSVPYARNADTLDGLHAGGFAPSAHGHSGGDIISGTVAEGQIDGAIARDDEVAAALAGKADSGHGHDHSALNDDEPQKHRLINDGGTAADELWSASKLAGLQAVIADLQAQIAVLKRGARRFGVAVLIEMNVAGPAFAYNPHVAVDPSGNAVAVWRQWDGTRFNIWANHYSAGVGWGAAELIETDDAGSAMYPRAAMDSSGNAIAVWDQHDGTRNNVWANSYLPGSGWGLAELIETNDAGWTNAPQAAFFPDGSAIAVWSQSDGARSGIRFNRYLPGFGWGSAGTVETGTGDAYSPQVAVDPDGNAMAVWYQHDGSWSSIRANRFDRVTGWGTAVPIEGNPEHAYNPQVAMDTAGNALAVWHQEDGTRYNIWYNRYDAISGWGTAMLLETDDAGSAGEAQVAIDPSGNALAVWQQSNGTWNDIWANRYIPGSGWEGAARIETVNTGNAFSPRLAVDPSGGAVAVWQQEDGTRNNIWANRYTAGSGWGAEGLLETDDAGEAASPQVAVDPSGNAMAVWQQNDGTMDSIWANRF